MWRWSLRRRLGRKESVLKGRRTGGRTSLRDLEVDACGGNEIEKGASNVGLRDGSGRRRRAPLCRLGCGSGRGGVGWEALGGGEKRWRRESPSANGAEDGPRRSPSSPMMRRADEELVKANVVDRLVGHSPMPSMSTHSLCYFRLTPRAEQELAKQQASKPAPPQELAFPPRRRAACVGVRSGVGEGAGQERRVVERGIWSWSRERCGCRRRGSVIAGREQAEVIVAVELPLPPDGDDTNSGLVEPGPRVATLSGRLVGTACSNSGGDTADDDSSGRRATRAGDNDKVEFMVVREMELVQAAC
uniref:Uncharacterized protein n=1 Tax=Oryza meridionalis TaxID=40149 RepID=A0A0E0E1D7_9ORYZ